MLPVLAAASEGGWGLIGAALLLYIAWDIAGNPGDTIATFKKGFQEGYESLK